MTVVSTKEFNINQEKYLDLAVKEQVYIQREDCMFIVSRSPEKYKEPDEDLRRAVSMEVVRERLHKHVDKLFTAK
jgi:hypothetical protein